MTVAYAVVLLDKVNMFCILLSAVNLASSIFFLLGGWGWGEGRGEGYLI